MHSYRISFFLAMPAGIKNIVVPPGEMQTWHAGGTNLLKWKSNKDVYAICSFVRPAMQAINPPDYDPEDVRQKPNVVLLYNKNKVGVDKNDQLCGYQPVERKTKKWYKKLFWRVVGISLVNAFAVFKKVSGNNPEQQDFCLQVVKQLLLEAEAQVLRPNRGRRMENQQAQRLLPGAHFPEYVPPTPGKEKPCKRCEVCSSFHRKETRYQCQLCTVQLCVVPCMRLYHTYKDYKQAYRRELREG